MRTFSKINVFRLIIHILLKKIIRRYDDRYEYNNYKTGKVTKATKVENGFTFTHPAQDIGMPSYSTTALGVNKFFFNSCCLFTVDFALLLPSTYHLQPCVTMKKQTKQKNNKTIELIDIGIRNLQPFI